MIVRRINEGGSSSDTIVFISGYMFGSWTYSDMAKFFPNYKFISVEGVGTDEIDSAPDCVDLIVHRLLKQLEIIGVERFILIGHSMGGFVAQEIAKRYPSKVSKMCILASSHITEFKKSQRSQALDVLDQLFDLNDEAFFNICTLNVFGKETLSNPVNCRNLKDVFFKNRPDRESCRRQLFLLELLKDRIHSVSIKTETLVIYGKEDKILPPQWVFRLKDFFVVEPLFKSIDYGHMFIYEAPKLTASIIADWIK
jgi:3-oxoadipate enol-lactonase